MPKGPCVVVDLITNAGLGNQLFIYAAGLVAKHKTGLPLCILPAIENLHSSTDYRKLLFKDGIPVDQVSLNSRHLESVSVYENIKDDRYASWSADELPMDGKRDILMKSMYYQNYESIKSVIPQIRLELSREFARKYPTFRKSVFEGTDESASCFMHVRRGDYAVYAAILPDTYYIDALNEINKSPRIKTLYVLSDDVEYCRQKIDSGEWSPAAEVRWIDDPKDELKALYLMSMCKGGAIMSNSTFSCWGAFLGPEEVSDAVIVYPATWGYNTESKRLSFPEKWIAL